MREIKFRGRDGDNWYYGSLFVNECGHTVISAPKSFWMKPVNADTVGQYTGLKDAKGNEIYEGDILDIDGEFIAEVVYCDGSYELYAKQGPLGKLGDIAYEYSLAIVDGVIETFSVIGNVHDNPELLKLTKK